MWMTLGILFALICIALLGVMIYDSTRFVTVSYRLTVPHLKKRMRIVLLADLHNKRYGEKNQKLLAAVDAQKPDVVLVRRLNHVKAEGVHAECDGSGARPF